MIKRVNSFIIGLFALFLLGFNTARADNTPRFTENKGQHPENVAFVLRIGNADMFFEKEKLTFSFFSGYENDGHDHQHSSNEHNAHAYQMHFLNSNEEVKIQGVGNKYQGYSNYIKPNVRATNVRSYDRLYYEDIYHGVDLEYYGQTDNLKYDIKLDAGVDPSIIQFKYEGADRVFIRNGKLLVKNTLNTVEEAIPLAYQLINGKQVEVSCKFKLTDNVVSFDFPKGYDSEHEIVIDPTLIFSSYTGSTANNFGFTATYDEDGFLYGGGIAFALGYPYVAGSYSATFAGVVDIAVSKFSQDGTSLIYSTYIGGTSSEAPHSMVVNSQGQLVILGSTSSLNFPTSATAYDTLFNGGTPVNFTSNGMNFENGSDMVITILSADGTSLVGSTYFGGFLNDGINGESATFTFGSLSYNYGDLFRGEVIVDAQDNIYIASSTQSADIPVTVGVFDQTLGGSQDACLAKFNPDVSVLEWSSYLGGDGADAGYSLKLNSSNEIYVTGGTFGQNFPIVGATFNTTYQGGVSDGYVAHLSNDGTTILASSFIGTSLYDQSYFVEVDDDGDVYLYGQSIGSYPVSGGVYFNLNGRQFIQKLTPDLTASVYSTVFGSGGPFVNISPTAFLVDVCERVFISGWGGGTNNGWNSATGNTSGLSVTPDGEQITTDGSDFYFMVLEADAAALLYGSFFGGNGIQEHVDGGTSRFNKDGIIHQAACAGCGGSNLFPTQPGVVSQINGNSCNLGVVKLDLEITAVSVDISGGGSESGCAPLEVEFEADLINASNFTWYFGDGDTSMVENPVHVYGTPGVYEVLLIGTDTSFCTGEAFTDTSFTTITVTELTEGADAGADQLCLGDSAQLGTAVIAGFTYEWEPPAGLDDPTIPQPLATPTELTEYVLTITTPEGCEDRDTALVSVGIPNAGFDLEISQSCEGDSVQFINLSEDAYSYYWNLESQSSEESDPIILFESGEGPIVSLIAYNLDGSCADTLTVDYSDGWPSADSLVVSFPNVFTPNGDQINDCFTPSFIGELDACIELKVFSRWGRLLYNSEKHGGTCWDGTQRTGDIVAEGTYYYIANVRGMDHAGYVMVIYE